LHYAKIVALIELNIINQHYLFGPFIRVKFEKQLIITPTEYLGWVNSSIITTFLLQSKYFSLFTTKQAQSDFKLDKNVW